VFVAPLAIGLGSGHIGMLPIRPSRPRSCENHAA
jgi:hypothetical protein